MPNDAGCLRGVSGHDSKIRVAVTKADELKWIFPQEKPPSTMLEWVY
jgi:hypothetical protein